MQEIKSKLEFFDIIKKDKVLIDFYADWCGPCQIQTAHLEEFEKNNPDIEIYKINTDRFLGIAREYRVVSIPSLKVFSHGKVKKEAVGLQDLDKLNDLLS